jgi:GNAT superfamily N-acetyltransferase
MAKNYLIKEITGKQQMLEQLPLIQQLQPMLTYSRFENNLNIMLNNGYRMIGVFEGEKCIALTGIWINAKLYCGKYLEIDNFVVDEKYRSSGLGKLLLARAENEAKKNNCLVMMLDAYKENTAAHKFYEREGFEAKGLHFIKKITNE